MAFKQNSESATYIRVADGKLIVKCKEGEPNAKERTVSKGKNAGTSVWEVHHDSFEGHIKGVHIKKDETYGDQLNISVSDGSTKGIITLPLSGRHTTKFILVMNNIDLEESVTFSPYKFPAKDRDTQVVIKDKFVQGWNLYQHDDKLENSLDIKDFAELEKVKVKGVVNWDDSARLEQLTKELQDWIDNNFSSERSHDKKDSSDDDEDDNIPY